MVISLAVISVIIGLLLPIVESSSASALVKTEFDGIWLAVTTIAGVGYGDIYPVTTLGRILTMVLEIVGVILFGSIAAFVSVELLRYQEDFNMKRVLERLDDIEIKLEEVKKRTEWLVRK
jgi:hypothetical protein